MFLRVKLQVATTIKDEQLGVGFNVKVVSTSKSLASYLSEYLKAHGQVQSAPAARPHVSMLDPFCVRVGL